MENKYQYPYWRLHLIGIQTKPEKDYYWPLVPCTRLQFLENLSRWNEEGQGKWQYWAG